MKSLHTYWILIFGILLVAGAVVSFFEPYTGSWIFAVGTALAVAQAFVYALNNRTDDKRESRLLRLNFLATLFLVAATVMIFSNISGWIVMVLIYAVIVFFLSFRGKNGR